ncbi:hypothetical protein SAMD00019534_025610 [Acytostelium subglobosum LB1]|uniref:hypothetical protein n=1 Tax=Acytostelium subglobosum LB1 TaxID=1410327 RepID=UPI0006450617|nr:hypothetical protein SAMD00019534_025610 [Acytostelium subglobosum LB1]GAM19386.1 hypothetical protein SAMD00019534_025610 [Acytostelium subglobosum LB1]|eukprot:XP_012757313.1 hypothetical protein SAMD00019534_025610 [Acytostelium subglobosum LB1]
MFNFNQTKDALDIANNYTSSSTTSDNNNDMPTTDPPPPSPPSEDIITFEMDDDIATSSSSSSPSTSTDSTSDITTTITTVESDDSTTTIIFEEPAELEDDCYEENVTFAEQSDAGDAWELEFYGTKLFGTRLRQTNKYKMMRIKRFFVKSYDQARDAIRSSNIADQCAVEKQSSSVRKSNRPTYGGPTDPSYEKQLRDAISMSAADYDRQVRTARNPLSQAQINDILNRELTPEDYELLLLLDTTVKPKTTPTSVMSSFQTVRYSASKYEFDTCMVCLSEFEEQESLTLLPKCNHIFHANCITNWLSQSSRNCPIDGLPCYDC